MGDVVSTTHGSASDLNVAPERHLIKARTDVGIKRAR
jgi:hypothetical protein